MAAKKLVVPAFVPNACGPVEIAGAPEARWVTVTPELALKWLDESNENNRPVRDIHVAGLAADMLAGRWSQNGEAIRFDTKGRLVDGQHRLWACYTAKTPFDTLLVTGVDAAAYSTIDIGAKKSLGDFLGPIHGEKNVALLTASLRLVYLWSRGKLGGAASGRGATIAELEQTLRDHPKLRDSVNRVACMSHLKKVLTSSFAVLLHYGASLDNRNALVEAFLDRLGSGLGLMEDDPVYHLRKFLLQQASGSVSARRAGKTHVLALLIKAWNATKSERKVRAALRFGVDEEFPQL